MSRVQNMVGKDLVFPFIDDMIAATDRYDEHLLTLRKILSVLREVGLKIHTIEQMCIPHGYGRVPWIHGFPARCSARETEAEGGGELPKTGVNRGYSKIPWSRRIFSKIHSKRSYCTTTDSHDEEGYRVRVDAGV